jgi:hypothetical protein
MILQERIEILSRLGEYLTTKDPEWELIKEKAYHQNQWFIPEFIEISVESIVSNFLKKDKLDLWLERYQIAPQNGSPKSVGIIMAGNIPLVGFHDLLCVFISGHNAVIKASSKDEILIKHLVKKMYDWDVTIQNDICFADRLNGCDAYIATGSNNSSRYFESYFGKYPNILRKNRTSVAVLTGNESIHELTSLADDAMLFFGLGCRNITQIMVPENYDFIPFLNALKKYEGLMEYHKYKNNFDYHLALLIMGGKYYMNNETVILTENSSPFSPVSQIHYQFYKKKEELEVIFNKNESIQCIVGHDYIPFGEAQKPNIGQYADGVDTLGFLLTLTN